MKIRTGFVSNSSTCSFIICIGRIINKDVFDKFMADPENKSSSRLIVSVTGKEILKNMREYLPDPDWCSVSVNRDKDYYKSHKDDTFAICAESYGDYHFDYECDYDEDDEDHKSADDVIDDDVRPCIDFFKKLLDVGAIDEFEYDYDWGYNG